MTNDLQIAPTLSLPLDAVTETMAIIGRRGSGKTHTATVICEEMLKKGQQVLVADPLDVWFGLRTSADGNSAGLPVIIFGGHHGDLPLEAAMGTALADLIVDERLSAVLSMRHLSKSDQRRFMADFAERVYDRKGEDQNRNPLHFFIDEADAMIPQRIPPGGERCYGAIDTGVRRGRASGMGFTLISQRPAVIAKDVLTQTEMLVCHQTTGPQDRKALEAWIEANDSDNRRAAFMASLASLKRGTAWFWSPSWIKIFKQVAVRPRLTFDSSSTPKAGAPRVLPQCVASVDLAALKEKLAQFATAPKGDDSATRELMKELVDLRLEVKRLRGLRAEAARAPAQKPRAPEEKPRAPSPEPRATEAEAEAAVLKYSRATRRAFEAVLDKYREEMGRAFDNVLVSNLPAARNARRSDSESSGLGARGSGLSSGLSRAPEEESDNNTEDPPDLKGHGGTRRLMVALVHRPKGLTKRHLCIRARLSPNSGTADTYLSRLKRSGFIEKRAGVMSIESQALWFATDAGKEALGELNEKPPGQEGLLSYWAGELDAGAARMLRVLAADYPEAVTRAELARRAELSEGGTFDTYLSRIRRMGLLDDVGRGVVRAARELFE